ncbi:GFA family protein [Maritimibacter sp. DP1N21-5]|uniref:GFA family protein n=1 Tax=Maritimibacter sp. DP1N21-5 TaxID=2836867 RepID=UPI001C44BADB|nr:GFA family protein [Maritimibacter sp. DP1N21-5]MBV7408679.1 GFA family protein [Maritimibacter sp. DP1N21-5]
MTRPTRESASTDDWIGASCLCGAVRFEITRPPKLTVCNCSACRRLNARWAYAPPCEAQFLTGEGTTVGYARGEKSLAFHHCPTCGCVTHWQSLIDENRAFNMALADDPAALDGVRVRHFDGADTWAFLD